MNFSLKMGVLAFAAALSLVLCAGVGSVFVPPADILAILAHHFFGAPLPPDLPTGYVPMVLSMRLPRVVVAFLTGAALGIGGTVMQSVLQNPLASPFGLGVSSGAGLGAALVIVLSTVLGGLNAASAGTELAEDGVSSFLTGLGAIALPTVSLIFALGTVFFVLVVAARLDRSMANITVVLVGMVVSLFCTAVMNLLATTSSTTAQRLQLWQLGSFAMKEWDAAIVMLIVLITGMIFFLRFSREMDILTFGEEQAQAIGVHLARMKSLLIAAVAVVTGIAVAFVGVIGFVDLVAPHIVRRWFGASHQRVLPSSALFGGTFLVLCDLAARTLTPPHEIPIGAITALIGAPFFLYIFFRTRNPRSALCSNSPI